MNISDYTTSVSEINGARGDKSIGLLTSPHSSSSKDGIFYTILEQNPEGALKVDRAFETLEMADITFFDYEFFPVITAEVEVQYGNLTKVIDVTVNLIDRNEVSNQKFNGEGIPLGNFRELSGGIRSSDGKQRLNIRLGSPELEFYNFSGISGTGSYLSFSLFAENFAKSTKVFEGEFLLDATTNDIKSDFVFHEIERTFDSEWQYEIEPKTITEGKVIYKRTETGDPSTSLREFFYDIKFMLRFSDGSLLTGSYHDIGLSNYFGL